MVAPAASLPCRRALRWLEQRQPCHALVGGVDSWLDPALLAALERDERVLAEGVMDGFVPGEAAGFLLLANAAAPRPLGTTMRACACTSLAWPTSRGHRFSTESCLGEGLSKAIATALASGAGPCATVLSTLNGENFASKEWGAAAIRNSHLLGRDWTMVHPADCFGDIGAAFGPVLIGIAARWLQQRTRTGTYLAWCASEGSTRGAVCVTADD
jgi:3-oxoacyl-[acyl-carrier-protein] synthase-1